MQPDWRAIPTITQRYGIRRLATWASAWGQYYLHRYIGGQARRIRGETEVTLQNQTMTFVTATTETDTATYYFEHHEADVLDAFLEQLDPTDTVFDIGANMGFSTCFIAAAADDVVAVEPYGPNVRMLRNHLYRNNIDNVTIREDAVSDGITAHSIPLDGAPQQHVTTDGPTEPAAVTTGDALAAEYGTPNAIKIDVEGAEGNVLDGLQTTLGSPALRAVLVEIHHAMSMRRPSCTEYGHSRDDVVAMLHDHGYQTEQVGQMPGKTYLLATR